MAPLKKKTKTRQAVSVSDKWLIHHVLNNLMRDRESG